MFPFHSMKTPGFAMPKPFRLGAQEEGTCVQQVALQSRVLQVNAESLCWVVITLERK